MLKGRRPPLVGPLQPLQDDLAERQAAVAGGRAARDPWQVFINQENRRAQEGRPRVSQILADAFHGKCAYCESIPVGGIDHHWPKAPGKANQGLGTSAKMFLWENMLPCCSTCNGRAWKGTKLKLLVDGRPLLLDPTVDDPICYLEIALDGPGPVELGWVDARKDLKVDAGARADYTIETLGLNLRDDLRRGRARALRSFASWYHMLRTLGPDQGCPPPTRIRDRLCELLDPGEPYLAPVRHLLQMNPGVRRHLLENIPELEPILARWDLPLDDCATLRLTQREPEAVG